MRRCAYCGKTHYIGPFERCSRCGAPLPKEAPRLTEPDEELGEEYDDAEEETTPRA